MTDPRSKRPRLCPVTLRWMAAQGDLTKKKYLRNAESPWCGPVESALWRDRAAYEKHRSARLRERAAKEEKRR